MTEISNTTRGPLARGPLVGRIEKGGIFAILFPLKSNPEFISGSKIFNYFLCPS
jgi:hypothetical protein